MDVVLLVFAFYCGEAVAMQQVPMRDMKVCSVAQETINQADLAGRHRGGCIRSATAVCVPNK